MNEIYPTPPAAAPAAATEVVHEQPSEGGSYVRNVKTGALVKTEPAPQPEAEE